MMLLTQPQLPWGLECGPQIGNAGNWFVLQYILTYWCATSALSWTWYYLSVHFISINSFLYFPWSMTPFLLCSLVRCCWNYWAKLTSLFYCQYTFESWNQIVLNQVVEHNTLIDIYSAYQWHLFHLPLLCRAQFHLCFDKL